MLHPLTNYLLVSWVGSNEQHLKPLKRTSNGPRWAKKRAVSRFLRYILGNKRAMEIWHPMDPLNMMLSWRSFGSKFKDLVGIFPSGTQPVAHGFPRKWCIQIPSYLAIIPRGFHVDGAEQNCTLAFLVSYFGSSTLPCISGLIIGWWQLKYFWNFHPYIGKKSNLTHIFQMGCRTTN